MNKQFLTELLQRMNDKKFWQDLAESIKLLISCFFGKNVPENYDKIVGLLLQLLQEFNLIHPDSMVVAQK